METTTIGRFVQFLHQIPVALNNIGQAIILILRDQAWGGICALATIVGILLTIYTIRLGKSKQAELDQVKQLREEVSHLKLLLREGMMYRQTIALPKKQTQKAPLYKLIFDRLSKVVPIFTPTSKKIPATLPSSFGAKKMLVSAIELTA